jgi:hypothetical protein
MRTRTAKMEKARKTAVLARAAVKAAAIKLFPLQLPSF